MLDPAAIRKIVDIEIKKVTERLTDKEITLEFKDSVYEYLAKEGYNPQYGARPLRRLIQSKVLTPLASMMITEGIAAGSRVAIDMDKEGGLKFDVKSSKSAKTKKTVKDLVEEVK